LAVQNGIAGLNWTALLAMTWLDHLGASALDAHRQDLVWVLNRFAALNFIDVFHPLDDTAPNRIFSVQELRVVEANEKLTIGAIGMIRASHRNGSAFMRSLTEFRFQVPPGAASSRSRRIACLGHEPLNNAVEDNAVIKTLLSEFLYARDMVRREIGPKLDHDAALGCFQDQCIFFIFRCHALLFPRAALDNNACSYTAACISILMMNVVISGHLTQVAF
jgi:hypothetical protein